MLYSHELFLLQLGTRLKQMRKDRNWTLRAMVVDHGFHLTHWQAFENGKGISVPSLLKVCGVFDISLEELVSGLGHSTDSKPLATRRSVKKATATHSLKASLRKKVSKD